MNAITATITSAQKLDQLCMAREELRGEIKTLSIELKSIEDAIVELVANEKIEGTKAIDTGAFKVTVTKKLNRSLDDDGIQELMIKNPTLARKFPFTPTWKLDLPQLRALQSADEHTFMLASQAITTKTAKPALSIKSA